MTSRTAVHAVLFLLIAASAPACARFRQDATKEHEAEHETFGRLTIEELDTKMAAAKAGQLKLAIYDNNQRERFDKGHIPGARWVKFDSIQTGDLPADKETTLVFYCANEH